MTPELEALKAELRAQLDTFIHFDKELQLGTVDTDSESASDFASDDADISVIDTSSNYGYSTRIGFFKPNSYSRGKDGIYRNDQGEPLSVVTPTEMRELEAMSVAEREAFWLKRAELFPEQGLTIQDIKMLATANHAPYRHIQTTSSSWRKIRGNVVLGMASRMAVRGESANNFVGLSATYLTMDAGYYTASNMWSRSADTNRYWGGFVNIYDSKVSTNTRYYDYGILGQTPYYLTLEQIDYNVVWLGKERDGVVMVKWRYRDYSDGSGVSRDVSQYYYNLSYKTTEGKLFRSTTLLSVDGAKSWSNRWRSVWLWSPTTPIGNLADTQFSQANATPKTGINEYPAETCPTSGGVYSSGPVYINCQDTDYYYTGYINLEVKY